jgi:hypothetical protein
MADGVRGWGGAAGARVGPHRPHPIWDGDAALTRRGCLRAGTVSAVAVTTVPTARTVTVMVVGGGAERHGRGGPPGAAGQSCTVRACR